MSTPTITIPESEIDRLVDEQAYQEAEARAVALVDGLPVDEEDAIQTGSFEGDDYDPFTEERFEINSETRVNWYLRKLRNLDAEIATVRAQAAAMIDQAEKQRARLKERFEPEVAAWTTAEIERRGLRGKSLRTLQGTLAWRSVPASVKVADEGEALRYAEDHVTEAMRLTLDVAAYRKAACAALSETGEVLPGVEIVPARESFSVKFGKSED